MSKKEKDFIDDESEGYFMTLVDEKGKEREFELYAKCTLDGNDYFALAPVTGGEEGEYVLLRGNKVGDEIFFETIDDDDEFERVEDFMGDLLFGDVDYDED